MTKFTSSIVLLVHFVPEKNVSIVNISIQRTLLGTFYKLFTSAILEKRSPDMRKYIT